MVTNHRSRGTAWEGRPEGVRAPYPEGAMTMAKDPEYRRTRETRWESGGPTLQG